MKERVNYAEAELDALREVANIGAGAAATELYRLSGSNVSMHVPNSRVLALEDVLDAFGSPDTVVTAIGVELGGELDMLIALFMSPEDAALIDPEASDQPALLMELGERLCSAFAHSIGDLTGMRLTARVAGVVTDMLGAVVETLVAPVTGGDDQVLLVDLGLAIDRTRSDVQILCVPGPAAVARLLRRLGVVDADPQVR